MNLHSLRNTAGARRGKRRVGRGRASGKGKTCGRGTKGQMARAGSTRKPTFEGGQMRLVRRLPKRGFRNRNRRVFVPVNVAALARFDEGSEVTVEDLRRLGLARGPVKEVKVLGRGDLDKKLTVKAHAFSAGARAKIEKAGGTCEVVR
jgi:large subunit ribosomal protein L15